jgi:peptidoglycan/LPS O-acetylase OafA/YrhL
LTYTFNYAWVYYSIPESSVSPFWSLSVEEQFYVFWPFIVLLLRKQLKVLLIIMISIIITCFAQMCFNIFSSITPYNLIGLFPRAGSLSIGALGAFLVFTNKVPIQYLQSKKIEVMFYIVLIICLVIKYPIKYPILPICSLFLILKAHYNTYLVKGFNTFLLNSKIVFIGSISYGIYIFHEPLSDYFTTYLFDPIWFKIPFASMGKLSVIQYNSWIVKLPLYSIMSIGLAHLSFKYFEKPILKLKDKYFKYK